uniref:FG-GAP repeat protein n=1 Tax=Amphora coffeiformis TaxID=265554 RepID=A0A7S3L124_9STRA|mmetsp:Transcript_18772/g.35638  ORF Transcript_18772/g.35638 Transcript_18772/m.35638 type:complete len:487 (+) Transcript_18772:426-1886(+)
MMKLALLFLLFSLPGVAKAEDALLFDFQPRVIPVEVDHSHRRLGSTSMPFGSPWCDGKPAVWMIGHQPGHQERPWCLTSANDDETDFVDYDFANSTWQLSETTVLERQDPLNAENAKRGWRSNIDRHDCIVMDVNFDGLAADIVCGVGAIDGTGYGFNEVYVAQPDGSLIKKLRHHGLNRWPAMRNRVMIKLTAADDGLPLVMLATLGTHRDDGQSNVHRMFKLIPDDSRKHGFFFQPHSGPWTRYTKALCAHKIDVNNDGLDDIILCQDKKVGRIYVQHPNSTFSMIRWGGKSTKDWREARVADVTGDGLPDLIVVGNGGRITTQEPSYVRVFRGTGVEPYFDFTRKGIWFEREMPYATPNVEILDVNHDGIADIYVVQADEMTEGGFCTPNTRTRKFDTSDWWGASPDPSPDFVPPPDLATDLLLIGTGDDSNKVNEVWMDHVIPGCGSLIEPFGNNYTMILSQGSMGRPGYSVLLQWFPTKDV